MLTYKNDIKDYLDKNAEYRECLFRRGYIITDKNISDLDKYPFYNMWSKKKFGSYTIYIHKDQTLYTYSNNAFTIALIGHAYNPFSMEYSEDKIIESLLEAYKRNDFFDKLSELTGIHLVCITSDTDGEILVAQDCCGMQSCYFGKIENNIFITEYPQLLGDILDINIDSFVEKLVKTKCYNIGNRHLPGNLSPYKELKRLGGNTYMQYKDGMFSIKRFYPVRSHAEFKTQDQFQKGIKDIYKLIHNGIECCTKKWDRRAISLSGGTDSKTTLACANGLYDKFNYYSFYSKPQELVDAKAAHKICDKLGLEHIIYKIPESNDEIEDFDFWKKLLWHNGNYIINLANNEIRKYIYLYKLNVYDVELKSWASETARVFLERKYDIKMPDRLTERHFSIFQTRYFLHPRLLKKSDNIYKRFMNETDIYSGKYNFEHTDLFYWEVRMGAWGTSVVSSQNVFHRVTMPMNNRKLLELFLSFPHEYRKSDSVHKAVMAYANKDIVDADVEVQNLYFHSYRIWMEKLYYYYRTKFYKSR